MQSSRADLKALKDLSDECCIKHGLTITEKGKAFDGSERCEVSTSKSKSYRVFLAAENGKTESWVVNIAASVLENKHLATSKEDFCERMNAAGINVRWTEGRKNITFSMGSKRVRSNKLQEYFKLDFSKEVLEREFECNRKTTIPAKEQDNHADEREQCFEREDKDSRSSSSARAAELGGKIEQVRARISKSFGRDEEAYSISIPKEEKTTTVPLRKKTKLFMQPSRYDELERSKERDFER